MTGGGRRALARGDGARRSTARTGFFVRDGDRSPVTGTFRTSVHASPLFATAMLRLVTSVDEALDRPDPLDVVDIGAGTGDLLRRIAVLAPTYLRRRLRLRAVELAPRPADLPDDIAWQDDPPAPGHRCTGVLLATEWLDNVPLDIAEVDADGRAALRAGRPGIRARSRRATG